MWLGLGSRRRVEGMSQDRPAAARSHKVLGVPERTVSFSLRLVDPVGF